MSTWIDPPWLPAGKCDCRPQREGSVAGGETEAGGRDPAPHPHLHEVRDVARARLGAVQRAGNREVVPAAAWVGVAAAWVGVAAAGGRLPLARRAVRARRALARRAAVRAAVVREVRVAEEAAAVCAGKAAGRGRVGEAPAAAAASELDADDLRNARGGVLQQRRSGCIGGGGYVCKWAPRHSPQPSRSPRPRG